jgi:hypothetical protein
LTWVEPAATACDGTRITTRSRSMSSRFMAYERTWNSVRPVLALAGGGGTL